MSCPAKFRFACRQAGIATLAISLILLALVTMVTLYANRAGIINLQTSANKTRNEEALAASERMIDQIMSYISANRTSISSWTWTPCISGGVTADACKDADGGVVYGATWQFRELTSLVTTTGMVAPKLYIVTPVSGTGSGTMFDLVAIGHSTDGTGTNYVRQGVMFFRNGVGKIPVPMMANQVPTGGNFSVVTNPNGGGTGVPVSIWSPGSVTSDGSMSTCQKHEFLLEDSGHDVVSCGGGTNNLTRCTACNCNASIGALTAEHSSALGVDIIYNDTANYPSDIFAATFGVPADQYDVIRTEARQQNPTITSCGAMGPSSKGMIWVDGDCDDLPNSDIGSPEHPVILIVKGDFRMSASSNTTNFYGVIFVFRDPADPSTTPLTLRITGSPTVYGAILTNTNLDFGGGSFRMRYEQCIFDGLSRDLTDARFGKIPGSWVDF